MPKSQFEVSEAWNTANVFVDEFVEQGQGQFV
jgi:hypothetical protein